MGTKKISGESQAQAGDQADTNDADTRVNITQVSADAGAADTRLNLSQVSDPAAEAPPPAIPDPIFATDDEGRDRPMSGGSFIRQPDGTLTRNPEA